MLTRLLVDPDRRLVTICGPGGMGKTRLALGVAAGQRDRFAHGVCWAPLASLTAPEAMVAGVAEALGFSFYDGDNPLEQLLAYLRRKSLLLVLDNFEHLLEGAPLVSAIVEAAPDVKVLATSRERLGLSGETTYIVDGLEFPGPPDGTLQPSTGKVPALTYSAVELFVQSARRRRPEFEPTETELDNIVRICRLVQEMPLGLLLAASWIGLLSPQEIAAEISRSLDVLETDLRDVPPRQRSARAVFDHSWRLLDKLEQAVFRQLSVFRGGFTREAAEAVVGASLLLLRNLVNKSFLQRATAERYEVHELLRQYGAVRLAEQPDQEIAVRDRHSRFYAAFLQAREADLTGPHQESTLVTIEADLRNAEVAWHWALKRGQAQLLGQMVDALGLFYEWRGRYQEWEKLCDLTGETLLVRSRNGKIGLAHYDKDVASTGRILAKILTWQARFNWILGDTSKTDQLLRESALLLDGPQVAAQDA